MTGKPNQVVKPVPLQPIPVEAAPFEYLQLDCVGPLPMSKNGCSLTWVGGFVDHHVLNRYPATYPLLAITTRSIVKGLSQFSPYLVF